MWALRTAWAPSQHGSPGGRWSGSPRGRPRLQRETALTFTARPPRAGRCGHGPERSGARPVCTEGDGDVSAGGGGVKEVMASSSDSRSVVYPFIQEAGGDLHGEARASWASRGGCSGACPPPRTRPPSLCGFHPFCVLTGHFPSAQGAAHLPAGEVISGVTMVALSPWGSPRERETKGRLSAW